MMPVSPKLLGRLMKATPDALKRETREIIEASLLVFALKQLSLTTKERDYYRERVRALEARCRCGA